MRISPSPRFNGSESDGIMIRRTVISDARWLNKVPKMVRWMNPLTWIFTHIPRSQAQLEAEIKGILRLVFWVAMVAPVILVPLYYLVLSLIR